MDYITQKMAIQLMASLSPDGAPTSMKDLYDGRIKLTDTLFATTDTQPCHMRMFP
jgi:hypothetical protein